MQNYPVVNGRNILQIYKRAILNERTSKWIDYFWKYIHFESPVHSHDWMLIKSQIATFPK